MSRWLRFPVRRHFYNTLQTQSRPTRPLPEVVTVCAARRKLYRRSSPSQLYLNQTHAADSVAALAHYYLDAWIGNVPYYRTQPTDSGTVNPPRNSRA